MIKYRLNNNIKTLDDKLIISSETKKRKRLKKYHSICI